MELGELGEFLEAATLTLPIGGRDYVVPSASGKTWLQLQEVAALQDTDAPSEMPINDLYQLALGPVWDQLIEDDRNGVEIQKAGTTAFYWQIGNDTLARMFWEAGGKEPARPSRATPTRTPGTGTTTKRRASTNGTNTRKR